MIPNSHPYWHVRSVVEANPQIDTLSMSHYAYLPQTVADNRSTWQISAKNFLDRAQIETLMSATPDEKELAIHSDVHLSNGERRHLVMVDMATSSKAHLDKLRVYLGNHFFQRLAWFSSGRSFHGYGEDLLAEEDWVKFMGLLLLANKPRIEPTVDPRWIGHRLLAGYAALRWTRNTSNYLSPPALVAQHNSSKGLSGEVAALGKQLRRQP